MCSRNADPVCFLVHEALLLEYVKLPAVTEHRAAASGCQRQRVSCLSGAPDDHARLTDLGGSPPIEVADDLAPERSSGSQLSMSRGAVNGAPAQAAPDQVPGHSDPAPRNGRDQALQYLRPVELKSQVRMGRVRAEDRDLQIVTHTVTPSAV